MRPKSNFEKELILKEKYKNFYAASVYEGVRTKEKIIEMINSEGINFYTYNHKNKTYTEIIISDNTEIDNIINLPITIYQI